MSESDDHVDQARLEAERLFLGRLYVVGVGIARRPGKTLVFFLDRESTHTKTKIAEWAVRAAISFEVQVIGRFQPSTSYAPGTDH